MRQVPGECCGVSPSSKSLQIGIIRWLRYRPDLSANAPVFRFVALSWPKSRRSVGASGRSPRPFSLGRVESARQGRCLLPVPSVSRARRRRGRSSGSATAAIRPELVRTLPPEVASSTGLDVICHAAESYLSRPYEQRTRPATPDDRPPYQGSNPIADVWSAKALAYGGRYLRRAVADGDDLEARGAMMLAATMAGVGFGSAGVHIPHACAYPIASLRHSYQAPGYPADHPFVPHGHSVIVTAPAAFRFTYEAMPERHHRVAELLAGEPIEDPGPDALPDVLRRLVRDIGAPSGIAALGYTEDDVRTLVEGTMKQQRLLVVSPRDVAEIDIAHILNASMTNW